MKRQPVAMPLRPLSMAVLVLATGLACKPWTVRPLDDTTRDRAEMARPFDAADYVASIWDARVLQEARAMAIELGPGMLDGKPPSSPVFVRGFGVVSRVDTRSRVGLAVVDLAPTDGRADVSLLIGPVLRGTTVRDALPFIRFGDFANQLVFADVANALNARVLQTVLAGLTPSSLEGRTVSFWGATNLGVLREGGLPEIVPVILQAAAR